MTKPDHSDLTIEDDDMLDRINEHERAAGHWRDDAKALRGLANSWHNNASAASTTAVNANRYSGLGLEAERKATLKSGFERACLVSLNDVLLTVSKVGQTWEINDSIYRVVTEGNPCVRLGCSLPVDEPDTDPEWSDRDEQAEKMAHYSQMTGVGQL